MCVCICVCYYACIAIKTSLEYLKRMILRFLYKCRMCTNSGYQVMNNRQYNHHRMMIIIITELTEEAFPYFNIIVNKKMPLVDYSRSMISCIIKNYSM